VILRTAGLDWDAFRMLSDETAKPSMWDVAEEGTSSGATTSEAKILPYERRVGTVSLLPGLSLAVTPRMASPTGVYSLTLWTKPVKGLQAAAYMCRGAGQSKLGQATLGLRRPTTPRKPSLGRTWSELRTLLWA